MLNSAVLDVAIGLVFVFLLVSFGVTAGNELVASIFKWRATTLAAGIRRLVDDPNATSRVSDLLYRHALIRGLRRTDAGDSDRRKPSYIPARLFATALLDIAFKPAGETEARAIATIADARKAISAKKDVLGAHVTDVLLALCDRAERDTRSVLSPVEKLQEGVEHWFDSGMDRVCGWYKRKTQLWSVILAMGIVVFVDIDSLRLARVLSNNPVLRAALVAQAEAAKPRPETPKPEGASAAQDEKRATEKAYLNAQEAVDKINNLGIPVGWQSEISIPEPTTRHGLWWWVSKAGGLVLTALAASLGAPFWFDILQKLFGLRMAAAPMFPGAPKTDGEGHPEPTGASGLRAG